MPSVQTHSAHDYRPQQHGALQRTAVLLYGVTVYVAFLGVFLYLIGFVGNFFVPRSMDVGPAVPFWQALAVDLSLIALFGVQHSIMARPAFKRWWTQFIPPAAERSTFVLATVLVLVAIFVFWRPIGGIVWDVSATPYANVLIGVSLLGWGIVFVSTFLINHFDLFGLRQVVLHFRGRDYEWLHFSTPLFYRVVRHPLYVGLIIAFWATPVMTTGHLVFAIGFTVYILLAIPLEERDLVTYHGEAYVSYQRRVSKIIPWFPKKG